MNGWEAFLIVLSWLFFAMAVLGGGIVLFAILVCAWRGIRKWFKPKVAPHRPVPYTTLGDIADELRIMKNDGMTRESIEYALNKVYH